VDEKKRCTDPLHAFNVTLSRRVAEQVKRKAAENAKVQSKYKSGRKN
jgi:hypothetical protein